MVFCYHTFLVEDYNGFQVVHQCFCFISYDEFPFSIISKHPNVYLALVISMSETKLCQTIILEQTKSQ